MPSVALFLRIFSILSKPNSSLARVSTLMRRKMPNHLITKCLWNDTENFGAEFEGTRLAENMDLGFDIAFGKATSATSTHYLDEGVVAQKLLKVL